MSQAVLNNSPPVSVLTRFAFMANALYASVNDSLDPLSESGRVVVWRKRRSRYDVGHRTVMY
jgi:hypothetical protein